MGQCKSKNSVDEDVVVVVTSPPKTTTTTKIISTKIGAGGAPAPTREALIPIEEYEGPVVPPEQETDKDSVIDGLLAAMTVQTQQKTKASVDRTRTKLQETIDAADATTRTLEKQSEQMDAVSGDLDRAAERLDATDKRFDEYEKWRIFGGKTNKKADKAEARYLKDQAAKDSRRAERQRTFRGGVTHDRHIAAPDVVAWNAVNPPEPKHEALVGRDDVEQAKLDEINRNDAEINRGLDDISRMLDVVEDKARTMHTATKLHNEQAEKINAQMTTVGRGAARANTRAAHNLRRIGGG